MYLVEGLDTRKTGLEGVEEFLLGPVVIGTASQLQLLIEILQVGLE